MGYSVNSGIMQHRQRHVKYDKDIGKCSGRCGRTIKELCHECAVGSPRVHYSQYWDSEDDVSRVTIGSWGQGDDGSSVCHGEPWQHGTFLLCPSCRIVLQVNTQ